MRSELQQSDLLETKALATETRTAEGKRNLTKQIYMKLTRPV